LPRLGAIAAFLAAAVLLAGVIVMLTPRWGGVALFACNVAAPALFLPVLVATGALFAARGYRSAGGAIAAAIALDALAIAYALALGPYMTIDTVRGALGLLGLAVYALLFLTLIPLGRHMLRFRALGGGAWGAAAMIYFALAAVMLAVWAAVALGSQGWLLPSTWSGGGDMVALGVTLIAAGMLAPAALAVHGVALWRGTARGRA